MDSKFEHCFLFCDESGNSGVNYLDEDQPFYVAAGIAVPAGAVEECRQFVNGKRQVRGAKELKGSDYMGSPKHREFALSIVRGLYKRGALVSFVLVEKRYALAAWFVNIFLDADAAGEERVEYNRDGERQRQAAQTIAKLPIEVLAPTNVVIRDPSEGNQRVARDAVVAALRAAGEQVLADEIEASALPSPALESTDAGEAKLLRKGQTPNTTGYMTLLALFNETTERVGAQRVDAVHDETASFEETFKHYFDLASDPVKFEQLRPWLEAHGYPRLDRIDASFVPSIDEPLVQAADVVAGGIAYAARSAVAGRPLDRSTMAWFGLLEKVLVPEDAHLPLKWQVVSEGFVALKEQFDEKLQQAERNRVER